MSGQQAPHQDPQQMLTAKQVADELSISTAMVYRLIADERIKAIRISKRCLRVMRKWLEEYRAELG